MEWGRGQIKALATSHGAMMTDVAWIAGVSPRTLRNADAGTYRPSAETAQAIIAAFDGIKGGKRAPSGVASALDGHRRKKGLKRW